MPCIAPGTAIEGSIGQLALRAAAPPRHATPELTCHAVLVDHPSAGRGGGTCGFDQQDTRRGGGRGQAAVLRERRHGESARASCVLSSRRLPQTLRSAPPQTPTTSLSCSQKIVVTVDLENNRLYETEQLNFGVSCVNSPTDQCPCPCNYATDANCQCRDLRQNISVAATKTAVYASYPLTYFRHFNGRPYEEIVVGSSCRDGENDAGATCGFAKLGGQDIPHSQGFCCSCPLFNLGGASTSLTRGNLQCGLISTQKSAHCLRLDATWWHAGFMIGEYALDFKINLNITTTTAAASAADANSTAAGNSTLGGGNSTGSSRTEVLAITPAQPFQRDSGRRVSAKLLGDLEAYQQAPQLDGKYLMIPTPAGEGPQESYSRRFNEWMVVDSSKVTTTGLECDKIGVDYAVFRNSQPNGCGTPQGSCLRNQIYDLYFQDLARIDSGREPLYFVGRYGGGTDNVQQMRAAEMPSGSLQLSLNLPIAAIKTSLLTLTVAADDVALVVNRCPAEIISIEVCTYDGKICGGFEAMAARGYLRVEVRNSGYVSSDYTITVNKCTAGVRPMQAQRSGIAPHPPWSFSSSCAWRQMQPPTAAAQCLSPTLWEMWLPPRASVFTQTPQTMRSHQTSLTLMTR